MSDGQVELDTVRAAELVSDLRKLRGSPCRGCQKVTCAHEALMGHALGYKREAYCASCLAGLVERDAEELRNHLLSYVLSRPCHHAGWLWAAQDEGFSAGALPTCLWPAASGAPVDSIQPGAAVREEPPMREASANEIAPHAVWDAGDMGCGDLVLELRQRLATMSAGDVLLLTARDPGAPEDLPAWCGLTRHKLLASQHPRYWIARRKD
ncbi:MAG: sulfurtransferase TusA family protein [Planctomycetota bacterium]